MHGGNAGLVNPVEWLDAIKDKHPGASYADIYTFAGGWICWYVALWVDMLVCSVLHIYSLM
jgi:hypothetical protein